LQELKPADREKWIRYCERFKYFIQTKTVFIPDVTFFTDEAWFHLSGYVNTQHTIVVVGESLCCAWKTLAWPEIWNVGCDI
jgi:hypothetical protein